MFRDCARRKDERSTVKMPTTEVTIRWCTSGSEGIPKVGAGTCVGLWCVVLPFRRVTLGPNIILAFITSLQSVYL